MDTKQIAKTVYSKLREHGYPYLAPTIESDGTFCRIELFNDKYPALQEIICYAAPEQAHEAKIYALWYAQRMMVENPPCGVVACVATSDLRIEEVD